MDVNRVFWCEGNLCLLGDQQEAVVREVTGNRRRRVQPDKRSNRIGTQRYNQLFTVLQRPYVLYLKLNRMPFSSTTQMFKKIMKTMINVFKILYWTPLLTCFFLQLIKIKFWNSNRLFGNEPLIARYGTRGGVSVTALVQTSTEGQLVALAKSYVPLLILTTPEAFLNKLTSPKVVGH